MKSIVLQLKENYHIKTLDDTKEILGYSTEKGIYENIENHLRKTLRVQFGIPEDNTIKEIISWLKDITYTPRKLFDSNPDLLHLDNGWLNVMTGAFAEHTPEALSMSKLAVTYDPKAKAAGFEKFMVEVLEPKFIKQVLKFFGYCLLPSNKYQKALMLVGEGSNGKSKLLGVVKAVFGSHLVSSETLQAINDNRFSAANLYGKKINICADISSRSMETTSGFLMMTGEDTVTVERKFQHPFQMENAPKLIFSTNKIPLPRNEEDRTYAYFRRWVVVPFFRTFEGEEADEQLLPKMTTPEELSGVLNLALIGLRMLEQEKSFSEERVEDIKQRYEQGTSVILDFTRRCIMVNPTLSIKDSDLVQEVMGAFKEFSYSNGAKFVDEARLASYLKKIGIRNTKSRGSGNRYKGLVLTDEGKAHAEAFRLKSRAPPAPAKQTVSQTNNETSHNMRGDRVETDGANGAQGGTFL